MNTFMRLMVVCSTLISQAAAAASVFYYTSSPTSWVGQGQTKLITPDDGYTFVAEYSYFPGSGYPFTVAFAFVNEAHPFGQWTAQFQAPFQSPSSSQLPVGFYDDAQRAYFQQPGHPGLNFDGNGRGSNTLTGWFEVLEAIYENGQVMSFAVDFLQHEEGNAANWDFGRIRYNSELAVTTVPEPATVWLVLIGLIGLAPVCICAVGRRLRIWPCLAAGRHNQMPGRDPTPNGCGNQNAA